MQLQPKATWTLSDPQSGWKGSPSEVGQMRYGLISFSKCSSTNFSHVRPSWPLNSNLFTSAFFCYAQFRRFLDTPRCSSFRQFSSFFIVSKLIHQEGAVLLVNPFSRGSFLICCPTLWCWLKCCMKQHITSSSGTHTSFVPELQCVTWVQIFQCNSSQEPREKNWRSVRVKGFAIRSWADEGWLISFSKYSSSNFSHVRPSWLINSNLFTSAFCCFAQFRRFLYTPRCSSFRHFSRFFIVSKPIHREGAVFLVSLFSGGSFRICCPALWCFLKCCMQQHTASSSGTQQAFVPYFILSHEFRSFNATSAKRHVNNNWRSVWVKMFAIRGWADEGGLFLFRSTSAAISPKFALVGSSTPSYLPLLSTVRPNFDYFCILRSPASLDKSLDFSTNPGPSTRKEQCSSRIPSQEDHLWFVARRSGVDSNAAWSNILHHHPVHIQAFVPEFHFVTWVQIFQCKSSQAPGEQKLTLSPIERVCHQELARLGCPHLVLEVLRHQFLPRSP